MVEFLQGIHAVSRQVFGREVAFLTYTSGTTGVRKRFEQPMRTWLQRRWSTSDG